MTAGAVTTPARVMEAAVITGPGSAAIRAQEVTPPGPGQVLVKVEGCGVCASNIPVWEGREWFSYPTEPGSPGHEGWGMVVETGSAVENAREGDRVAFLHDRAFADYATIDSSHLLVLPAELDGIPFPGEAFACAANVFRRSDIDEGHTVAVIGVGFIGGIVARLAASRGATVIGISRRQSSLDLASQVGCDETIVLDDHHRIIEQVHDVTGGAGCERVVEATGVQWPLDLAGELTAERGKLIVAGYHQDGLRHVNMQLWNWKGLDVINAHERDPLEYIKGMKFAVDEVRREVIDPRLFVTHSVPLSRFGDAMNLLQERPDGMVKTVVLMEEERV